MMQLRRIDEKFGISYLVTRLQTLYQQPLTTLGQIVCICRLEANHKSPVIL